MSQLIKARSAGARHSGRFIKSSVADFRHVPNAFEIIAPFFGAVKAGVDVLMSVAAGCISFETVGGDKCKWQ